MIDSRPHRSSDDVIVFLFSSLAHLGNSHVKIWPSIDLFSISQLSNFTVWPIYMHFVRSVPSSFICVRCLYRRRLSHDKKWLAQVEKLSSSALSRGSEPVTAQSLTRDEENDDKPFDNKELGAMSRRLAQMTDESLEEGGRSVPKALDQANFSEELKARLEARILDGNFKSDNPAAFAQLNMPVCLMQTLMSATPLIK